MLIGTFWLNVLEEWSEIGAGAEIIEIALQDGGGLDTGALASLRDEGERGVAAGWEGLRVDIN